MLCKETPTVSNLQFKCEECNFDSETEKELAWHMGKHHGWPSDQKTEDMDTSCSSQGVRYCVICDYEADLMKHKKDRHTENVNICWNFVCNNCEFGDERCWFLHKNGTEKQFDCTKFCQDLQKFIHRHMQIWKIKMLV
jgi:hypothetical protein